MSTSKKVLIVGGGFAGIRCALDLLNKNVNVEVTLISNKNYFEYYPAMYRVASGSSPLEARIQLDEIFSGKNITIELDTVTGVDVEAMRVFGIENNYDADFIVLALGSENNVYNIGYLENMSYSFKSVQRAVELKERVRYLVLEQKNKNLTNNSMVNFIVVGSGPSGVELAGELDYYIDKLCKKNNISRKVAEIELIERGNRILSNLDESVAERVRRRLEKLGVKVKTSIELIDSKNWQEYVLKTSAIETTVIWTAGVHVNPVCANIKNIKYNEKGRILVNGFLEARNHTNFFIAGDIADTPNAGLAQTAIHDGRYIAKVISAKIKGKNYKPYKSIPVGYDIPVGAFWAVFDFAGFRFFGFMGWVMRHLIDIRFFMSILPFPKAIRLFFRGLINRKDLDSIQKCHKHHSLHAISK